MWCFLCFLCFLYAPEITVTGDLVALLQQEIALVFLGQFRRGLQRIFVEEKPFPVKGTDLEIAARWRYEIWENGCKVCAPLRPFKSKMKENFYNSILPHVLAYICAPVWKYFSISLQGTTKKLSTCSCSAKSARYGRANVCAHRKSVKPLKFQKCLGAFYRGWYVVVHPCSFLSRVSILLLTRDIDIVILSVCTSVCLSVCPSVCPSVRLSVTRWYCMKTA